MPGMSYDEEEDEKTAGMMKKYTKVYGELDEKDRAKLKEHAKHHTPQHMQMMMDLMKNGASFEEAHNKAQKKYPSPDKEMKGGMQYDEKKAAFYMKKKAGYGMKKMKEASVQYIMVETDIDEIVAHISAATGKSVIRISGIAFHEGINKNKWQITKAGAEQIVEKMIGADLTLNHPPTKEKGVGFVRNMDGGVNDAVVGVITEATFSATPEGYEVRYVAEVRRPELFPALESGLWSRDEYGVSIGGWGIPIATAADGTMTFEDNFTFDHLAIVHKPAYERANIESVQKVESKSAQNEADSPDGFKYAVEDSVSQGELEMTDELEKMATELEELRAELILANATIDDIHAREAAAAEEARLALVAKATEIGLKGHDDLSSETIENLIASWEAARPAEPTQVLAEATPAADEVVEPVVEASNTREVVASYHNGIMLETDADIYERAYNALARAYNSNLSSDNEVRALTFSELVAEGLVEKTTL